MYTPLYEYSHDRHIELECLDEWARMDEKTRKLFLADPVGDKDLTWCETCREWRDGECRECEKSKGK